MWGQQHFGGEKEDDKNATHVTFPLLYSETNQLSNLVKGSLILISMLQVLGYLEVLTPHLKTMDITEQCQDPRVVSQVEEEDDTPVNVDVKRNSRGWYHSSDLISWS